MPYTTAGLPGLEKEKHPDTTYLVGTRPFLIYVSCAHIMVFRDYPVMFDIYVKNSNILDKI
jgi:hypothetical protein